MILNRLFVQKAPASGGVAPRPPAGALPPAPPLGEIPQTPWRVTIFLNFEHWMFTREAAVVGPVYPCHGYRPLSTPVTRTRLTKKKLRLVSPSIFNGLLDSCETACTGFPDAAPQNFGFTFLIKSEKGLKMLF